MSIIVSIVITFFFELVRALMHKYTRKHTRKANTVSETKQKIFHRSNSMGVRFVIHELLRTRNALIEVISSPRKKSSLFCLSLYAPVADVCVCVRMYNGTRGRQNDEEKKRLKH